MCVWPITLHISRHKRKIWLKWSALARVRVILVRSTDAVMTADPRGYCERLGDRQDPASDHVGRDGQRTELDQLPDHVGQLLRDLGDQQGRVHPPLSETQPAGLFVRCRHCQVRTRLHSLL